MEFKPLFPNGIITPTLLPVSFLQVLHSTFTLNTTQTVETLKHCARSYILYIIFGILEPLAMNVMLSMVSYSVSEAPQ